MPHLLLEQHWGWTEVARWVNFHCRFVFSAINDDGLHLGGVPWLVGCDCGSDCSGLMVWGGSPWSMRGIRKSGPFDWGQTIQKSWEVK
jgi:hypothetical protein